MPYHIDVRETVILNRYFSLIKANTVEFQKAILPFLNSDWEENSELLIAKLQSFAEQLDKDVYRECILATKDYINSRDFAVEGRYVATSYFYGALQYNSETQALKNLNQKLDQLIENIPEKNVFWQESFENLWTKTASTLFGVFDFAKENPIATIAALLYGQMVLVATFPVSIKSSSLHDTNDVTDDDNYNSRLVSALASDNNQITFSSNAETSLTRYIDNPKKNQQPHLQVYVTDPMIQLNVNTKSGDQTRPTAAYDETTGNTLIIFQSGESIFGAFLDENGDPLGGDFFITANVRGAIHVVAREEGGFLLAYNAISGASPYIEIYLQKLTPSGAYDGSPMLVPDTCSCNCDGQPTNSISTTQAITLQQNGAYGVVWATPDLYAIGVNLYFSNNTFMGNQMLYCYPSGSLHSAFSSIDIPTSDKFAIHYLRDNVLHKLSIYNSTLQLVSNINAEVHNDYYHRHSKIYYVQKNDPNDDLISAVYDNIHQSWTPCSLKVQFFTKNGELVGTAITITEYNLSYAIACINGVGITATQDGNVVVTWADYLGNVTAVEMKSPSGDIVGGPITVCSGCSAQNVDIIALPTVANSSDIAVPIIIQKPDEDGQGIFMFKGHANCTVPILVKSLTPQLTVHDTSFSFIFPADTFFSPDGSTLTYTSTLADGSDLPSWLNFESSTRTFSSTTPDRNTGVITVRVIATGAGGSRSGDFSLTVIDAIPQIINNRITVRQGLSIVLDNTNLKSSDSDDVSNDILYNATIRGFGCEFRVSGLKADNPATFSQGQIDSSLVEISNDDSNSVPLIDIVLFNTGSYQQSAVSHAVIDFIPSDCLIDRKTTTGFVSFDLGDIIKLSSSILMTCLIFILKNSWSSYKEEKKLRERFPLSCLLLDKLSVKEIFGKESLNFYDLAEMIEGKTNAKVTSMLNASLVAKLVTHQRFSDENEKSLIKGKILPVVEEAVNESGCASLRELLNVNLEGGRTVENMLQDEDEQQKLVASIITAIERILEPKEYTSIFRTCKSAMPIVSLSDLTNITILRAIAEEAAHILNIGGKYKNKEIPKNGIAEGLEKLCLPDQKQPVNDGNGAIEDKRGDDDNYGAIGMAFNQKSSQRSLMQMPEEKEMIQKSSVELTDIKVLMADSNYKQERQQPSPNQIGSIFASEQRGYSSVLERPSSLNIQNFGPSSGQERSLSAASLPPASPKRPPPKRPVSPRYNQAAEAQQQSSGQLLLFRDLSTAKEESDVVPQSPKRAATFSDNGQMFQGQPQSPKKRPMPPPKPRSPKPNLAQQNLDNNNISNLRLS